MKLARSASLLCCLTLAMVVSAAHAIAGDGVYIKPVSAELEAGRSLWLDNCENCHGHGTADAPVPMRPDDWRERVNKDTAVLYEHAINGFIGPDYSMMPARGGNEDLSDSEVRAAVDYMLFLANYYIKQDKTFIQP